MRPLSLITLFASTILIAGCSDQADDEAAGAADATAEATPAFYVGTWAANPQWCTDQSEGFPVTIEGDRFLGRENTCDMSDVAETPEGGWTAQLSCESEGTTTTEALTLSPVGDQLALAWPDRDAASTVFSRCEQ